MTPHRAPTHRSSRSVCRRQFRPRLEALEDRSLPSVSLGVQYPGLDHTDGPLGGDPDVCVAAGPNRYVEAANKQLTVYTPKTSNNTAVTMSLPGFFGTANHPQDTWWQGGNALVDPAVIYDTQVGAFIVTACDRSNDVGGQTYFDIAVSSSPVNLSGDQTSGAWVFYQIDTSVLTEPNQQVVHLADQQVITLGGAITGGSFTLTFNGSNPTTNIQYDSDPAKVALHIQNALNALGKVKNVGGSVSVTSSGNGVYQVTFQGTLAGNNPLMTVSSNALTGTSPTSVTVGRYVADYPCNPGYNRDALVVAFNMKQYQGKDDNGDNVYGRPDHSQVVAVSIDDLVNVNRPLRRLQSDVPDVTDLRPTLMHGSSAGGPMWLLSASFVDSQPYPAPGQGVQVYKTADALNSSPAYVTTLTPRDADNQAVAYTQAVLPRQPLNPTSPRGTSIVTDKIPSAIQKVAEATNLNLLVAIQAVGISPTQDVAQWYAIDVSDPSKPYLKNWGRVSALDNAGNNLDNTYIWNPSIDINPAGAIGMTYLRSGTGTSSTSSNYMSMWITGLNRGDLNTWTTTKASTNAIPVPSGAGQHNYPDYNAKTSDLSGINVDPGDNSFWAVNEFAFGATPPSPGDSKDGNWGTAIANFTVDATNQVEVQSVVVNDGAVQRSMVASLAVSFSEVVTLAAGAFELRDAAGNLLPATITVTTQVVGGRTVATLTFGGAGVVGGSLADGRYTLTVRADHVTGPGGPMAADYAFAFYRLFGDGTGDGVVDVDDLLAFASAYGSGSGAPGYAWWFDSNADGVIDVDDLLAFADRYGSGI